MECPLCQSELSPKDALPYMAIEICPNCWKAKNSNQNSNEPHKLEQQKISTEKSPITPTSRGLDSEILYLLESIEQKLTTNRNIEVKNINMPFISMVGFMVKWVIASIPAMIILFILGVIINTLFGSFIVLIT